MNRSHQLFVFAAVLLVALLATPRLCLGQQFPKPTGYVNDFAQALSKEVAGKLNAELIEFEKKTTIEFCVVTVSSLGGSDVESYTRALATEWGIGKRNKDNGVVFLIAPNERKMRIQTASGIRSVLTDDKASRIRDYTVLPKFKSGNMAAGILDGSHEIMRVLGQQPEATPPQPIQPLASRPKATNLTTVTISTWPSAKSVVYMLSGLIIFIGLAMFISMKVLQAISRKRVLEQIDWIARRFMRAERDAKHADVTNGTRETLRGAGRIFEPISRLNSDSRGVNWIKTQESLDKAIDSLGQAENSILADKQGAAKARVEGPKLMASLPNTIAGLEARLKDNKISSGNASRSAQYLNEAKKQLDEARERQSAMSGSSTDWLILYLLLADSQSRANQAAVEAERVSHSSTDHSSNSSRSSSDSSSSSSGSSDFGSSSSFGGGGGFDGGGGGATGSW